MLRNTLGAVSFIAAVVLWLYPVLFVTFPWTIPAAYLAALIAAMAGILVAVCR